MKYYPYLLILISVVFVCFFMFHDKTNFTDVEQYVTINNVSLVHNDHDFFIEVQFTNNSEHDIELRVGSDAGVELVYLPTLYLNNEFIKITNFHGLILIPAKSFVEKKFLLDKDKRQFCRNQNMIDFFYTIQTWRCQGKTYTIPGKSITFEYKMLH